MSKYRDYVRTLPCCVSGVTGEQVQAHHIIGSNWLTGKGVSKKGSDLSCIPLEHSLHMEIHSTGWSTFEQKHNIRQLEVMIKTILQAEKDGIITIEGKQ